MPLQSSGQISLNDVQTEFGGTNPINIDEYYRGGSLVPNTPTNSNIPTSGTIAMDDFYGGTAGGPASYNVSVNNTSINEGNATTVTVTTANVPNGTNLYYRVSGTVENYFVGVTSASSAQVGIGITNKAISVNCTRCTDAAIYNYFWTPAVYAAWDVDGDGIVSIEDSIRIIRWLISSSTTNLDAGDLRLPSNATRLTNSQMLSHINTNNSSGYYDLDGDGSASLFTDGIMGARICGSGIQTSGQNGLLNPQDGTPAEFISDFQSTWNGNQYEGPSYQGRISINSNTGSEIFTALSDSITENSETFAVAISTAANVSTALTTTQTVTITNTSSGISSDAAYYTPGSYVFTVPDDTEVISAVAIGGGGGGSTSTSSSNGISGGGGGGGALHYNTFEVTPGEELAITVGPGGSGGTSAGNNNAVGGSESSIKRGTTYLVRAGGGSAGLYNATTGYTPGGTTYSGTYGGGGGNGGRGGCGSNGNTGGGGGGAGGYSGNGGDGSQGTAYNETAGSGGGGGGGTGANGWTTAVTWGGGGVDVLGEGSSGGANATTYNVQGEPGSNGTAQNYGGGGSGAEDDSGAAGAPGAGGAVRLIWGANRSYPSTNTLGPASYSFTTTPTSVTEGSNASFVLGTTNVLSGSTLYWTILHGTTSSSDFPATSSSFTTQGSSTTIDIPTTLDAISESTETFQLEVRTGSTSGTVVATSSSVNLTNLTPTAVPSSTSISEGNQVNVTVTAAASATYYYTISGTMSISSDFSSASSQQFFTNSSGSATLTFVPAIDSNSSEGTENFQVQVRTGSISGTIIATSSQINVADVAVTGTVTPSSTTVTEGNSLSFTVNTNINKSGQILYYTLDNGTATSADFTGGNSGSFTVNSLGDATVSISHVADGATEGNETYQFRLREGSTSGTIIASSSTITISDAVALSAGEFEFKYYAYGSTIGTLSLYWHDGTNLNGPIQMVANGVTVNSIQGQQQTGTGQAWRTATADFSSYSGTTGRPVFRYLTGTSFTGDIQLDKIKLGTTSGEVDLDPDLRRSLGIDNWQQGKGSSVYGNIGFTNVLITTSATYFWNYDPGGTPSGSTGNTVDADGSSTSYYLYAETSSPNYSSVYGWLRTSSTYSI